MSKIIIIVGIGILILIGAFILIRNNYLITPSNQENPNEENPDIIVDYPEKNQVISSPLLIEGKARGTWFFEASFPIKLFDENGNQVAAAIAQTQSDWMTEDFVPFRAEIEWTSSTSMNGTLVFQNDNPSGLPENAKEFRLPIIIGVSNNSGIIEVKVFFNNSKMDPEFSCNKVFSVERKFPVTEDVAGKTIEELLKGPTEQEKAEGFFTSINPGVEIQSLKIENGVARIDFNEQLEFQVGGSCRVAAIRAEITQTLMQFLTMVKSVIISINGRTEDILQP
ncbi:MAG: hypothetical protein COU82_00615 [Candidatus Portnoybacteria bacterium CG10_big_fil_rev_8_21_14_0_10_38_18]|uniref:GerMN domain-containing protein n=1 Tax=Candidatus Portnoybacteria bacterium CG10_big_fil_rev_8_21_14_0_10_38_18 TaxID=1974813 RepID=A0A2M8KCN6_9BACT|nr:MAG: hypothetical protein COU82_00615 [Candidatus Portnoybacteria bacterium CG10_big_fil_rev_8_21_14_0_10_38_18]